MDPKDVGTQQTQPEATQKSPSKWRLIWSELRDSLHRFSWFRTAPRRQLRLKARIRPVLGGEFKAETFDVSLSGAYISLEKVEWLSDPGTCRQNLVVGSRCMVRISIDQFHVIHVNAEIVRHGVRSGTHPEGFAVRFMCLEPEERRILSELVRQELALKPAV